MQKERIKDAIEATEAMAIRLRSLNDKFQTHLDYIQEHSDLVETCLYYYSLKELHALLDGEVKRLYHMKERLNKGRIPELFEDKEVDKIAIKEVARSFYPVRRMSASMVDKQAAFEWLRSRGLQDLIQPTVNSSSLAAACKELLQEEGVEPPSDAIKLSPYSTTGMSKYTPK